jgi:hypothetical protein
MSNLQKQNNELFKLVEDDARGNFLNDAIGREIIKNNMLSIHYENLCYSLADFVVKENKSAFWYFAYTNNNIPFMFFTEKPVKINTVYLDNEQVLPGVLAGLSISAQACSALAERFTDDLSDDKHDALIDRYHILLKDGRDMALTLGVTEEFYRHTN